MYVQKRHDFRLMLAVVQMYREGGKEAFATRCPRPSIGTRPPIACKNVSLDVALLHTALNFLGLGENRHYTHTHNTRPTSVHGLAGSCSSEGS